MTTIASDHLVHVTGGEDCNPYFDRAAAHIRAARDATGMWAFMRPYHRLVARGEWRDGGECEAFKRADAKAG